MLARQGALLGEGWFAIHRDPFPLIRAWGIRHHRDPMAQLSPLLYEELADSFNTPNLWVEDVGTDKNLHFLSFSTGKNRAKHFSRLICLQVCLKPSTALERVVLGASRLEGERSSQVATSSALNIANDF